jgi:hypothetical protein
MLPQDKIVIEDLTFGVLPDDHDVNVVVTSFDAEVRLDVKDVDELGRNVIKLFTDVIYESSQQARVFVYGKPFQPLD